VTAASPLASPRLAQLARQSAAARGEQAEHCELCGEELPDSHRHLLDLQTRELVCACRACALLFDHRAAGGHHWRLVPDRRLRLEGFSIEDADWEALRIPVGIAFIIDSTTAGRAVAHYPSPLGSTDAVVDPHAWERLRERNPVLRDLAPDVEALLINRARGARQYWLVPLEDCARLIAIVRTRWRGLTGGGELWEEIERFFERLEMQATEVP
jgi:hypothetical protein